MGENVEEPVCTLFMEDGSVVVELLTCDRLEKRRQAMLEMPQMIATWKERGHGRGWKKWPK